MRFELKAVFEKRLHHRPRLLLRDGAPIAVQSAYRNGSDSTVAASKK
jgi:hypothetical protein